MLFEKELNVELCVVGGGLAGVCTAISSARNGVKVALVQERPVLGGNASSEIRMWVCGAHGENNRETGIIEEIMLENLYRNPTKNHFIFDSILLDFVKREKNVTLLLNTTCMDAETEIGEFKYSRSARIKSIKAYQMTTETFYKINSKFFADCSGDSILAPLTDAEFRYGREQNNEFDEQTKTEVKDDLCMGLSCLIQARETDRKIKFIPSELSTKLSDEDVKNRPMNIYDTFENFWYLELGGLKNTIADAEETKDKLIPLALGTWDYIKNHEQYKADNYDLEFLGFLPAKRESRRMVGEYIITQKDITNNVIFPDTVAFGGWGLDDHYPAGYYHKGEPNTNPKTPAPYCIPLRALYSKNIENLYFAGRNISMTHAAMSSIRVMATCALLGEAVGTAVSIAVKYNLVPHEVYLLKIDELQQALMKDDCFIPHFRRKISSVCKSTPVINGSDSLKTGHDRPNSIYGNEECGITVKNGTALKYSLSKPTKVNSIHVVFDSDLCRTTLPGDTSERIHVTRAIVHKNSPQTNLPTTLCKRFSLKVDNETVFESDNNIKRCIDVKISKGVSSIELTIYSNYGNKDETKVFSFDFD